MNALSAGRVRCLMQAGPAVFYEKAHSGSRIAGAQVVKVFRKLSALLPPPALRLWSKGSILLEAAVAVLVFGTSTAPSSGERNENQATAENIARNQMENVFTQPYLPPPASYPSITVPSNYTVTAEASEYFQGDSGLAKLKVTVSLDGANILTLESLRAGP